MYNKNADACLAHTSASLLLSDELFVSTRTEAAFLIKSSLYPTSSFISRIVETFGGVCQQFVAIQL